MGRFIGFLLTVIAALLFSRYAGGTEVKITGQKAPDYLTLTQNVETSSVFLHKEEFVSLALPYHTRYVEDPEKNWGETQIQQIGVKGQRRQTYQTTYWYNQEMNRQLVKEEVVAQPQDEVLVRGTKKVARTGSFERCGEIAYVGKMRVWTTSYDKYCSGCLGVTYTGLPAGYGTVAVDPQIIPLYSRLCIPGYGLAVAGDIGGAVKGNIVDLGFDDVRSGWWSARWTDIYLLP